MAEALVVLLILIFWGPWPIFSIWAGLRFRRNPSQAPSGLTALLRVSFAIALTWVMVIVTAYAWFIWANVARGEPVFVVAAHAVALAPAFWVTRYRLQVPVRRTKGDRGSLGRLPMACVLDSCTHVFCRRGDLRNDRLNNRKTFCAADL